MDIEKNKDMIRQGRLLSLIRETKPANIKTFKFNTFVRRNWTRIAMGLGLSLLTFALCLSLGLGIALRHHHEDEDQDNGLDAIVDLGYTKYNGRKFADGISHWLGMRYAAAPVGILRFAEPHHPPQEDAVQSAVTVCIGLHAS